MRFFMRSFSWSSSCATKAILTTLLLSLVAQAEQAGSEPAGEPSANEVVITEQARLHFKAGVNLLQDPEGAKYDEAYEQFKAAYAESPSWKILGNLGLAAMHLERYGEAIDSFSTYLEQGGDSLSEQEQTQFQRDLETLQASVATLEITAPAGTDISDTRRGTRGDVRNYYVVPESGQLMLRVRPGQHAIVASSGQSEMGKWSVRIESQGSDSHTFSANSAGSHSPVDSQTPSGPGPNIPAYAALGVGAIGVGVGVAFSFVRAGHDKKADDQYAGCVDRGDCGSTERASIEERDGKAATAGTVSLISFGVGALGLGTGLALLLMGEPGDENPIETKVGRVNVSPYAGLGQLGVMGSF
jgi:hypothetical protein